MNEPNKDEPKISFDVFMTFKTWELEHDIFILKQKIKARNIIIVILFIICNLIYIF